MADPLPEDVAALCNHAGLDSSLYRDFTAQRNAPATAVSSSTVVDSASGTVNPSAEKDERLSPVSEIPAIASPDGNRHRPESRTSPADLQRVPSPVERAEQAGYPSGAGNSNLLELPLASHRGFAATHSSPAVADNPRVARDRWSAIRDVFSADAGSSPDGVVTHTLPLGSISLFAVGGGVGKTTIGATLARVLTGMGESVLLAGLTPGSILPLYFGARSASGGRLRSFLMPREDARGSLHLYLDSLSFSTPGAGEEGQQLLDRLCSQAELVRDDIDRAIVVFPGGGPEPLMPILQKTSIRLVIIVPDLASAIGVGKLMRFFKEQQNRPDSPYFLINKFDSARVLHQEMRNRLHDRLGARLLPLVIRRSDEIQDALAAGMTVIDYAPGTCVAQDFQHLADWIRAHSGRERAGQ
jgi:cellulose synthase operon protein YhjQ